MVLSFLSGATWATRGKRQASGGRVDASAVEGMRSCDKPASRLCLNVMRREVQTLAQPSASEGRCCGLPHSDRWISMLEPCTYGSDRSGTGLPIRCMSCMQLASAPLTCGTDSSASGRTRPPPPQPGRAGRAGVHRVEQRAAVAEKDHRSGVGLVGEEDVAPERAPGERAGPDEVAGLRSRRSGSGPRCGCRPGGSPASRGVLADQAEEDRPGELVLHLEPREVGDVDQAAVAHPPDLLEGVGPVEPELVRWAARSARRCEMMIRPGDHSKKFSSLPQRMNAFAEKCLNSGVSNEST